MSKNTEEIDAQVIKWHDVIEKGEDMSIWERVGFLGIGVLAVWVGVHWFATSPQHGGILGMFLSVTVTLLGVACWVLGFRCFMAEKE